MSARGVNLWYGEKQALFDVDLTLAERRVTALIGPSGCGKSTFLRCLNRMNDIIEGCRIEGDIRLDGDDIYDRRVDVVQLRAKVGMVFQKPNPFPKSIYENVAYGPRIHGLADGKAEMDEIVESSLKGAGLWDEVKDRLSEPGNSLSGGQQQRLCIARAIAVSPEVILMDEPCSALDPIATAHIEELIDELRQNFTIAIVTHNMQQAARVSQRTAFFHLGKLIEFAEHRSDLHQSERSHDPGLHHRPLRLTRGTHAMVSQHIVKSYDQEINLLTRQILEMGGAGRASDRERDRRAGQAQRRGGGQGDRARRPDRPHGGGDRPARHPPARDPPADGGRSAPDRDGDEDLQRPRAHRRLRHQHRQALRAARRRSRRSSRSTPSRAWPRSPRRWSRTSSTPTSSATPTSAVAVWHRDDEVDDMYTSLFRELLTYMMEDPRNISACLDLIFVAKNLERIGDHTTNIAEKIHYMIHGQRINRLPQPSTA